MKYISYISAVFLLFLSASPSQAQIKTPTIYYSVNEATPDTLFTFYLPDIFVFAPLKFKNEKERLKYTKLVRDVKKTLPYAKMVSQNIIESYEMMQTLPTEKERQKFLEDTQKFILDKYKPEMKKMTRTQGKILIKLIDRETSSSSYDIVKSLVGSFKAGVYNIFAGLFGNSLKTRYDPEGEDKMIERIAIEIEQGNI